MDSSKYKEYKRKCIPGKKTTDLVALILCFAIQSGLLVNCYKLVTPGDNVKAQFDSEISRLFPSKVFEFIGCELLKPEAHDKKLKSLRTYMVVSVKRECSQDIASATDKNEPLEATYDKVSQNAESTSDSEPLIVAVKPKDCPGETHNETAVQTVNPETYFLVVFKPVENQGTHKEMKKKWSEGNIDLVACLLDVMFNIKKDAESFLIRYAEGHRNIWNLVLYKIGERNNELIGKVAKVFGISIVTAGFIVGVWITMVALAPVTGGGSILVAAFVTAALTVALVVIDKDILRT